MTDFVFKAELAELAELDAHRSDVVRRLEQKQVEPMQTVLDALSTKGVQSALKVLVDASASGLSDGRQSIVMQVLANVNQIETDFARQIERINTERALADAKKTETTK